MAMATLLVSGPYTILTNDPTGFSALIAAVYLILVTSFLSRLPEGSGGEAPPTPAVTLPGRARWRENVRSSFWWALGICILGAAYAYLTQDYIPLSLTVGAVLWAALFLLSIHTVFDALELLRSRKLARIIGGSPKRRSRLRRIGVTMGAMCDLVLLVQYLSAESEYPPGPGFFLALIFIIFSPFLVIYGVHRLFQFIQSRRVPPLSWPQRKRSRWHKAALWFPTLIAVLVVLFLPQSCGLVGHLRYGAAQTLSHFRIRIPWNWWMWARFSQINGDGSIEVLFGPGIAQVGFRPYLSGRPPLSSVSFSWHEKTAWDRQTDRENAKAPPNREFHIGADRLKCWELPLQDRLHRLANPPLWIVDCAASRVMEGHEFSAGFLGQKGDIPSFYEAVAQITRID